MLSLNELTFLFERSDQTLSDLKRSVMHNLISIRRNDIVPEGDKEFENAHMPGKT